MARPASKARSAVEGASDDVDYSLLRSLFLDTPSGRPTHQRGPSSSSLNTWDRDAELTRPSIAFTPLQTYPPRILVTGGAGFVGSHLVDRLMLMGHDVVVLDNLFSGAKSAIGRWIGHPNFEFVRHDVTEPLRLEVDEIYHLACPASPKAYQVNPVKTMKTNFVGTLNMLGLAKRTKARFLLASTSEVYGSPDEANHPQKETYWGSVNCVGDRACYDEGKRVSEALAMGYHRQDGVDVRIARIFNTFGPRMSPDDGRVVSNFVVSALRGEPITVYGDGHQTRSLCYVTDLIDGLIALMNSDLVAEPVNIGNNGEATILEWAKMVLDVTEEVQAELLPPAERKPRSQIVHLPLPADDPPRRRPDTTKARERLGFTASFPVEEGIKETVRYFLSCSMI